MQCKAEKEQDFSFSISTTALPIPLIQLPKTFVILDPDKA